MLPLYAFDGETYTTEWQTQAEMLYDGLGNRLQMTGYADGQSLTTQYELDNGRVLSADAAGNITFYLYGLGPIGELTTDWAYSLPDGSNTPRQLTDADGEITFAASYTPWGDTLETHGTGRFTQGYFGGIMDAATGLIYVGNGQYYDPATGRFLTRDAHPNQNNPYTPIDPTSALLGPLALLALAYGRKKSRGKWDMLVILLVLSLSLGMGLVACGPGGQPGTPPPTSPPTETPGPGQGAGSGSPTPPTPLPNLTPECPTPPTPTPTPSPTPIIIPNPTEFGSLSSENRFTNISAQEIYNHYLVLWNRQDSGAWWWDVYGKDDKGQYDNDGFSFWDYVSIYMNHEAGYFHTDFIGDMSEAGVRFWYQRAKEGYETIGDEGFVNWWAGFSQSNAEAVKHGLFPIKQTDTETHRQFRVMADNFKNPENNIAWTTGIDRRRPYNWGNESAIKLHSRNSRVTEMFRLSALKYPVVFRYLPGADPFYVPSGCAQINWIDGKDENIDTLLGTRISVTIFFMVSDYFE